jgi:hypothetical protein
LQQLGRCSLPQFRFHPHQTLVAVAIEACIIEFDALTRSKNQNRGNQREESVRGRIGISLKLAVIEFFDSPILPQVSPFSFDWFDLLR